MISPAGSRYFFDKKGTVSPDQQLLTYFVTRIEESWENQDLENFLEAVAAWSAEMDTFYANQGKEAPKDVNWTFFAEMLFAAKIYE
ncbi:hypothetical protein D9M70_622320 [compost metagenome]